MYVWGYGAKEKVNPNWTEARMYYLGYTVVTVVTNITIISYC